jgi:4-amino-4-deoxy-L-arabinose transferase-like glycosyltransferase
VPRLPRVRPAVIAALLIAIGAIRMSTTWRVFSATNDEGTHLGAGLELYQFHRYELQSENPPLPRVIYAAVPWLSGMRFDPHGTFTDQIRSVFYGHGDYRANLFRGRAGTAVFFIIAAIAVFFAARDALGDSGALAATFLFTMEPVVLGYSALTTHDGPAVAGLAVALLAFTRWLRVPDLKHALIFGAAFGFSIHCKFTSILYVPVTCIAFALVRLLRDADFRQRFARALGTMIPAAFVTLFVIWAGYAFTVHTFAELRPWIDSYPPRLQHLIAHISPSTPLPAPSFFVGLSAIHKIDKEGMESFLCGRLSRSGWWWYFPFAVALKTTIAALLLFVSGLWFALRDRELRGVFAEWSLAALAIVAVALPTTLDLGVRYILPFYVPFAIASATAVVAMLRANRAMRFLAIALLVGQLGASAFAHPDYFPYFNAFAGRDPSRYLVDSNIDWGQDILRLRSVVRRRHIPSLSVALMGPADYVALGFPPIYPIDMYAPTHGWVAVSDHPRQVMQQQGGCLWLPPQPTQRVGKSISLYYIP